MNKEIVGLLATSFVVMSFVFKDIKKVRTVNIVGAILFVIYGLTINALSIWISNSILIGINMYYLIAGRKW